MSGAETIIQLNNVSCASGRRYLLRDVQWKIKKGDHWLIFGQNGCGKTTLLSLIAGYQKYSSGEMTLWGEPYTAENVYELRKKIGWISASFFDKHYHEERVLDIVLSGLLGTLGVDYSITDQDIIRAKELLEQVNLKSKIDKPFQLLSKGERQNVLIARALISNPEILVLDEPGTGLDVFARETLLNTIRNLALQNHTTMLYVTHYPEEIIDAFDQCILMKNGLFFKTGKTEELFCDEIMSEFFDTKVTVHKEKEKIQLEFHEQGNISYAMEKAGEK